MPKVQNLKSQRILELYTQGHSPKEIVTLTGSPERYVRRVIQFRRLSRDHQKIDAIYEMCAEMLVLLRKLCHTPASVIEHRVAELTVGKVREPSDGDLRNAL